MEAHRVLGVELPPPPVRDLSHGLQRVVVVVTPVGHAARGPVRLQRTQVGGLQDGAQGPLRRHRVLTHELPVGGHDAAKVLRPGPVHAAVDDHMPDLPGPQLLGEGRKGHESVDLALGQMLHGLGRSLGHEANVLAGIQADVGGHAGDEHVVR